MTWKSDIIEITAPPVRDADGQPTGAVQPGYRLNTTHPIFDAVPAIAPYRVTPAHMLDVWAGDDPNAPTITVALLFPDQATAQAVLAAYWEA